jgi:hypothetical protein
MGVPVRGQRGFAGDSAVRRGSGRTQPVVAVRGVLARSGKGESDEQIEPIQKPGDAVRAWPSCPMRGQGPR